MTRGVPDWLMRPHQSSLTWTALAAGQTEGGLQGAAAHLHVQGTTVHRLAPQYLADISPGASYTIAAVQ